MRRAAAVAAVGGALALATGAPANGGTSERLPDLRAARPAQLIVVPTGTEAARRYELGFRSAAENVGRGPLVIVGRRRVSRTMLARQVIERRGPDRVTGEVGRIRYVRGPDHSHWHLLRFMRYELRSLDRPQTLLRDRKTGFCLGDRFDISRSRRRGEPEVPVFRSACGVGRPSLRRIEQGISVGYGDDYAPLLEGQSFDVTDLPDGRYRLVHRVNPTRRIRERRYANNVSSLNFALTRPDGAPRVTELPAP